MKQLLIVIGLATSAATGLALGEPITTSTSFMFRDHKGPNTVGTGVGDTLTVVVPNVRPNLTTTGFATNPQVSGNIPLSNLFTSRTGFFTRSFATTLSTMAGSVTAPSTITLTNGTDTLSVPTNGTAGVQQLPLLSNLAVDGGLDALAPTLSWDPVTTAVPYDQVRLSIYIDRTDQIILTERVIGGPGTNSYTIPSGTLAPNTDYVFRVYLWDGDIANVNMPLNRSSTFVYYTTTSTDVGVGGLQIAYMNGGMQSPLVLASGPNNNYPDTQINIGRTSAGAAMLTNGTTLTTTFLDVGNAAFAPANNIGTLVIDNTTVVLNGSNIFSGFGEGAAMAAGRNGNGARGFIDVINGGRIEINSSGFPGPGLNAGRHGNTFGNINVDGAGSTIVINGPPGVLTPSRFNGAINVGRLGDGRLNITGGGQVLNAPAGAAYIGRESTARGSILVSGGGSIFDAGSELHVGPRWGVEFPSNPGGEGVLRVENGGLVVADVTTLGPGGLLTGSGGTLQSFLLVDGGVFAPGSSPGKMIIDGDMTVNEGLLQLEAFGPGQSDEIEVTGTITIGAAAIVEIQLGYTPTTPLTFLTAGTGINLDPGFAGPTVVGQLGTEAQGLNGATVQVVIGDQTFAAPVQVPPIDPDVDYDGDGVPDGIDACPGSSASANLLIGGCDTGASNVALGNGCKVSDAVRACELSARNHGKFVSCVAGNANQWRKNGLISGNQRGAIQACAAK